MLLHLGLPIDYVTIAGDEAKTFPLPDPVHTHWQTVLIDLAGSERLADLKPIEPSQVETLFAATARLVDAGRQGQWIGKVLDLSARVGQDIPEALAIQCAEFCDSGAPLTIIPRSERAVSGG